MRYSKGHEKTSSFLEEVQTIIDQTTHDIRRTNWLNIVNQCQNSPSDMSVKQWLAENDIKEKAYYYWLRKFRKEAYAKIQLPAFAPKAYKKLNTENITFPRVGGILLTFGFFIMAHLLEISPNIKKHHITY